MRLLSSNEECTFIFDIDGVLIDSSARAEIAEKLYKKLGDKISDYIWSSEMVSLDKPRIEGVKLLLDRLSRGKVVIITGRRDSWRKITIRQLKEAGVPIEKVRVIMKSSSEKLGEAEWKEHVIKELEEQGLLICEVHDNNEEVLERLRKSMPNTCLVYHSGGYVEYYRRTSLCRELSFEEK